MVKYRFRFLEVNAKYLIYLLVVGGFFSIGYESASFRKAQAVDGRRESDRRDFDVSPGDSKTVDDRVLSRRGIEDALVQVFSSHTDGRQYPICLGTVIQSNNKGSLVLTSAHCISPTLAGKSSNPFLVQKVRVLAKKDEHRGVYQSLHQVAETYRHPRFSARQRTPLYDIALLRVPTLHDTSVASIYRVQPIEDTHKIKRVSLPQVTTDGAGRTRVSWRRASTSFISSLLIGIRASNSALCHGSSGAPVVLEAGDSFAIVAVISRGVRDCKGEATASVVSSALSGFIEEVEQNRSPKQTIQTCPECQAELAYGIGPCVTPLMRCFRNRECARVLEMLNGSEGNSTESKVKQVDTNEQSIAAVLRCLCHTPCRKPCSGLCRRVNKK